MLKIKAPVKKLNQLVESQQFIGKTVNFDVLNFSGVFVLKNIFCKETIEHYSSIYFRDKGSDDLKKTPLHLTEVKFDSAHDLNRIILEPEFIKAVAGFFRGNVGNDFIRVVKKDDVDIKPVFLHQDTGYQVGGYEKYSCFISLTNCNADNGSLVVYPGTQHFGYLGDVGEIADILPEGYPKIVSNTKAGDILIMHSSAWHESPENKSLTDRVYLEVHIQDANDPSTKNVICGKRNSEWKNLLTGDEIFSNSRTQRLKSLYQQIDTLTKT